MSYENKYAEETHKLDKSIEFVYIKAPNEYVDISSTKIDKMAKEGKDISNFVPRSVVERYKKR